MRLLVTGATGFIGRTLVLRALEDRGIDQVIAPVRSEKKLRQQLAREGVGDLQKLRILEAEAPHWDFRGLGSVDRVVHCAGVLFGRTRDEYFRVNVDGTLRLIETLAGQPPIVLLSSQAAGGPTPLGRFAKTEEDPDCPISWYGESKLKMEEAVRARSLPQPVFFLRAPMVLGPGDRATLPLFRMVQAPIWPKPGMRPKHYSWVSSDDLVSAIDAWFDRGERSSTAHVTSPGTITDISLMETVARVSGRRGLLLPLPQIFLKPVALASKFIPVIGKRVPSLIPDRAREIWPDRWVVEGKSFHDSTGWHGKATLEETLRRTLAWFRREGLV